MFIEITMPKLGESITEGTISKWLVKEGDFVEKYAPIAEVLTDKVTAEIPAACSGTIQQIIVKEGETVPVGHVICMMKTSEEKKEERTPTIIKDGYIVYPAGKKRYSPAVLQLAKKHHLDLQNIPGTGFAGRVTRKDVLTYIRKNKKKEDEKTLLTTSGKEEIIPLTPVRKAIASHLVKSKQEIPHAWMMIEVDVTNLVELRKRLKDDFYLREGYPLTYLPFFIKAVVNGLRKYPLLNSVWEGDKIVQKKDIHLSIAVATEDALYVPVIKHADEKSIKSLAKEIHELALKVRNKKITFEEMQGGTFTVNNTGSIGSVLSMPIINYPQAAIITFESIVKRPVVINDMIAIRSMANVCLSLDHRILDGLICGKFLQFVKEQLETMTEETISIY